MFRASTAARSKLALAAVNNDTLSPSDAEPSSRQIAVAVKDRAAPGTPGEDQPDRAGRPRVVAKGHGKLAEQILAIAFERGIKVRSDADLAEILAAVDVDSEIPLEALAAVSEILSYVYRCNGGSAPEEPS
jgi:flagellar biosynthesis protein